MQDLNEKLEELDDEVHKDDVQIPNFGKSDMARCVSCNSNLRSKNIREEQIREELAEKNPNKFYFWELKQKSGKFGVGYSQALSSIRSTE